MATTKSLKPTTPNAENPVQVSAEQLDRLRKAYASANAARAELGKVCYTLATLKSKEGELINAIARAEADFAKELGLASERVGFNIQNIDLETGDVQ